MTISITVYPYLSPRVVVVNYPQSEATIQEIYDAIRTWEDSDFGDAFPYIIDAGGKEALGGGVSVGITATLQNAQIRFAARPVALSTGTITTGDPDGKILIDIAADFVSDGVYVGCTAFNLTTFAMETILEVSATQLPSFVLQAGSRQDWQVGDSYIIYPNEQCQITGGNLVAVDAAGVDISPVLQSPNTNVIRTGSSSATLVGADPSSIADAVWDEPVDDHLTAGTFGEAIKKIKFWVNALRKLL